MKARYRYQDEFKKDSIICEREFQEKLWVEAVENIAKNIRNESVAVTLMLQHSKTFYNPTKEKVYLDSEIRGIFRYTGSIKKEIKNNFLTVKNDLLEAEKKRLKFNILSKIRQMLPKFILNIIFYIINFHILVYERFVSYITLFLWVRSSNEKF